MTRPSPPPRFPRESVGTAVARGSLWPPAMRTAPRTTSSKRLLAGAVVLPLLFAACLPSSTDSNDSANQMNNPVESANDQAAFDYFVSKGLTDDQAAGIVGNLDQESGMSPTIAQSGGGPGRGIAQWSVGGRWDTSKDDNVTWYAAQQGASADSLDLQLDFIWYELTTFGYGYSELRAATTVSEAVTAFQDYYEICGTCVSSNRLAYAEAALAAFGGTSTSGPTSCSVAGVAGTCIATTTCATMKGYASTAGYCPGAADIECCTPTGAGSSSSSSSSSTTSSSSSSSSSSGGSSSSSSGGSSSSSSSSSTTSSSGSAPTDCTVGGTAGTCIDTSTCASMTGYTSTPGYCPGAADVECCTPPPSCSVNGVSGVCIDTSVCASNGGTSTPGYCPGSASEECCTQ